MPYLAARSIVIERLQYIIPAKGGSVVIPFSVLSIFLYNRRVESPFYHTCVDYYTYLPHRVALFL
jgi:hypothetical protein